MVAKKQRLKKAKKPNICPLYIANVDNAEAANIAQSGIYNEMKTAWDLESKQDPTAPQPTWRDVATLLQGQADLLRLVNDLYVQLDDPTVKLVLELKRSIDEMKSQLQEVRDDLNRHELDYSHCHRDPYD